MKKIAREIKICEREGCSNTFEAKITGSQRYCCKSCAGKSIKRVGIPLSPARIQGYKNRVMVPWNKGLTKETDARILKSGIDKLGDKNPMHNHEVSEETREKLRQARLGFKCSDETKEKMSLASSKRTMAGVGGNRYYKRGYIFLERLNVKAFYRSSYEKAALLLLDSLKDVLSISVESIMIEYKDKKGVKHHYIPDYLVTTENDFNYIIEVKPNYLVKDEVNQLKFTAARKYAVKHNMVFLIWTEDILFSNNSVETTLVEVIQSVVAADLSYKVDDIVRTVQKCMEVGRNDLSAYER